MRPAELGEGLLRDKTLARGRLVTVRLRLYVGEAGAVEAIDVLSSDGPADALLLDDVRSMRFLPAIKQGRAVKSQALIELTYEPAQQQTAIKPSS